MPTHKRTTALLGTAFLEVAVVPETGGLLTASIDGTAGTAVE